MFYRIKESSFQGIQQGNLATVDLPTGWTYYKLDLAVTDTSGNPMSVAALRAELGDLTIKANGRSFIDQIPISFLLDREEYYNAKNGTSTVLQPGIVPIRFAVETFPSLPERGIFAIGTANLNSLDMQVRVEGSTVSTIDVYSYKSDEQREFGTHIVLRSYNRNFAGVGSFDEANLPDATLNAGYRALFITEGSGAIDNVLAWRDNTRIFEEVPASVNNLDQLEAGRTPLNGYYVVDFGLNNTTGSLQPLPVSDWRQRISWGTSPGSFTIFAEMVEGLPA